VALPRVEGAHPTVRGSTAADVLDRDRTAEPVADRKRYATCRVDVRTRSSAAAAGCQHAQQGQSDEGAGSHQIWM